MAQLPVSTVANMLREQIARGTIDGLPRNALPDIVRDARIEAEMEHHPDLSRSEAKAVVERNEAVFVFDWGYMSVHFSDADLQCTPHTPPSLIADFYITAGLQDEDVMEDILDVFPEFLEAHIDDAKLDGRTPDELSFLVSEGGFDFDAGRLTIWFEDDAESTRLQCELAGMLLGSLTTSLNDELLGVAFFVEFLPFFADHFHEGPDLTSETIH
jgi:hypothetical protein